MQVVCLEVLAKDMALVLTASIGFAIVAVMKLA